MISGPGEVVCSVKAEKDKEVSGWDLVAHHYKEN